MSDDDDDEASIVWGHTTAIVLTVLITTVQTLVLSFFYSFQKWKIIQIFDFRIEDDFEVKINTILINGNWLTGNSKKEFYYLKNNI